MVQSRIKWYDYIACFWFADQIATGLLGGNILLLVSGIISYTLYADIRKGSK